MFVSTKILNRQLGQRCLRIVGQFQNRNYGIEKNFEVTSSFPDVVIPDIRLDELVFRNASKWPNHVALVLFE